MSIHHHMGGCVWRHHHRRMHVETSLWEDVGGDITMERCGQGASEKKFFDIISKNSGP